jgi:hypothetical protein
LDPTSGSVGARVTDRGAGVGEKPDHLDRLHEPIDTRPRL